MIWSGLLIYWNDSDNAYQHPHAVYRIGMGPFTLVRFFPDGSGRHQCAVPRDQGLGYHFFFMWIFAMNGFLYVLLSLLRRVAFRGSRAKEPERSDPGDAKDLHLSNCLPPQTKYNGAQRLRIPLSF